MESNAVIAVVSLLLLLANIQCEAQLSPKFYDRTCPGALSTIRTSIRRAISRERRMAASLIRLHFHDCFVQVGGPTWPVKLGRRDSTTASSSRADRDLPAFFDPLNVLISKFSTKGLNAREMAHTHLAKLNASFTFRERIYSNGTNIDVGFASTRRRRCPRTDGDSNLAPLDLVTPNSFGNNYFKNLIQRKGLLQSDQVLFSGGSIDSIVSEHSKNPRTFSADFASAMVKMGDIKPLTGRNGIIRRVCCAITNEVLVLIMRGRLNLTQQEFARFE